MITAIDKNTALVMIDLQKGILKRQSAHPINEVLEKASSLADAFRSAELPIVVVTVNPLGASWLRSRKDEQRIMGNRLAQTILNVALPVTGFLDIADDIKTQSTDIFITKKTWNAFYNTPLHDELQRLKVTGIVLCGVATSIGVEGTARAASELGYNISFATDAMTDSKAEAHENSLRNIFPRIGELGTTSDIIEKLRSRG
jgi:nicotinamidase-related amidase